MIVDENMFEDAVIKEFLGLHAAAGLTISAPSSFLTTKKRIVMYQGVEMINDVVCIVLEMAYSNSPVTSKNLSDWIDAHPTRVYLDTKRRAGKQSGAQL